MKQLETNRLILRDFTLDDVDDLYEYASLDTVGPSAGWAPHNSKHESLQILRHFIEKQDVWAIELKEEGKVIGSIGLHKRINVEGRLLHEVGYVLSTPYEGHGYMTEACKKVLNYAFMDLDVDIVKVAHFLGNDKSRRVIEKCGFIYEKEGTHQSLSYGPKLSKIYYMTKTEYLHMEGIL
ncbi:MAG: GNAT family N-acetyltransferase [Candidatus Izemoplasmatales bacterium]